MKLKKLLFKLILFEILFPLEPFSWSHWINLGIKQEMEIRMNQEKLVVSIKCLILNLFVYRIQVLPGKYITSDLSGSGKGWYGKRFELGMI